MYRRKILHISVLAIASYPHTTRKIKVCSVPRVARITYIPSSIPFMISNAVLNVLSFHFIIFVCAFSQGWHKEFSDGRLTLPTKGVTYSFQGTIVAKNLQKHSFSLSEGGQACLEGGYSPLALLWRHPCSQLLFIYFLHRFEPITIS